MHKMLQAEIWTIAQTKEGSAVLLRPKGKSIAIPIFVGQLEVQSILIGKEGISLPRPLTHDLFLNLLDCLDLVLERVEIHELVDNTFHARLVICGGKYDEDNPLILDSRPSDAIGLSTRSKCPIFISSLIVRETGIPLDLFIDVLENSTLIVSPRGKKTPELKKKISPLEEKHRQLLKQLNDAVEKEEYEQAAEIRDLLKKMDEDKE